MSGGSPAREFILGMDAATPAGGVALAALDGRLLAHVWRADANPIARWLLPDVDRLMRELGIRGDRIAAVAVTRGPGSFTGVRLGLALAKTLAHGWGVPLYPFSTLEIAARRWPVDGELVGALLDARRGEIYSGLYRIRAGERPLVVRDERAEPLEAFLEAAAALEEPLALSGSGAARYREAIERRLGPRARWIEPPWDVPAADVVALAGAWEARSGRPGVDPLAAAPVYLRVSDAERRHGIVLSPEGRP